MSASDSVAACWARGGRVLAEHERSAGQASRISCWRWNMLSVGEFESEKLGSNRVMGPRQQKYSHRDDVQRLRD